MERTAGRGHPCLDLKITPRRHVETRENRGQRPVVQFHRVQTRRNHLQHVSIKTSRVDRESPGQGTTKCPLPGNMSFHDRGRKRSSLFDQHVPGHRLSLAHGVLATGRRRPAPNKCRGGATCSKPNQVIARVIKQCNESAQRSETKMAEEQ